MFRIPAKTLIVNSASQLRILKYDGSATYIDIVSPLLASTGFFLEGFLPPLLFGSLSAVVSTTLIKSTAGAAGTKQIATFTANAVTGAAAGEPFVLQYDSLISSPTEFQNQPLKKHYTLSATLPTNATDDELAGAIEDVITADKNAPVTATVVNEVVTLTAKDVNTTFAIYMTPASRGGLASGTFAVTTPATKDLNTYDDLKNLNWAKADQFGNLDFDRNAEQFPVYGQTYKSYRFRVKGTPLMNPSLLVPSLQPVSNSVITDYMLYIANGLTLQTTMDLVVADANAAV